MKNTFEMYLINVGMRSDEYSYEKDILFDNIEYFKKCYNDGLSAYKALLLLYDDLEDRKAEAKK